MQGKHYLLSKNLCPKKYFWKGKRGHENIFLDTSAFEKYYHEEVGSEEIKRIYSEEERVLVISDISITEFHSATARKVRRGEISKETFEIVRKAFYKDLLNGL